MKSNFDFVYEPNGNKVALVASGDRLYEGQVGTAEYSLRMKERYAEDNWLPTDVVLIAFKKPNGDVVNQRMTHKNGVWRHMSNGWETNFDGISTDKKIRVSFICRRYSAGGTLVATRTTEEVELQVFPSGDYTYLDKVDEGTADDLLNTITDLEDRFCRFEKQAVLVPGSEEDGYKDAGLVANVEMLDPNVAASVEISKQVENAGEENERHLTRVDFHLPRGHTIREIRGAKADEFGVTQTQVEVELTDGSRKDFDVNVRNGIDGNGFLAVNVVDGDLYVYTKELNGVDFSIDDDDGCLVVNYD